MKVAVVYWSGTGNTQAMADAVAGGARGAGADVTLTDIGAFDAASVASYDALAFGCPAMGMEVLEETVFDPAFGALEGALKGKKIGLFGSYGWGDGEWMRAWADRCAGDGAVLAADPVICLGAPEPDAVQQCAALGAALAS